METSRSLRDYFEISYQQGGIFKHEDYRWCDDEWGWLHKPTGITVWGDALDLSTERAQVVFHYTNFLAFKNITNEAKEDIELWASLEIEGPTANAWYGRGLYTVPLPPDGWEDIQALLDNNYRNMMRRDLENRGEEYVRKTYPARAKYCIPILVDPADAYDVSVRQTPEMVERGVPPGYNLKMMPLSEPGMRPRMCITVRIEDEKKNVCNPKAKLLDVVKRRAQALASGGPSRGALDAMMRVAAVELKRGLYEEAVRHYEDVVRHMESFFGVNHRLTLRAMHGLAEALALQGDFGPAEAYMSMVLTKNIDEFGEDDGDAVHALGSLGNIFRLQHKRVEAQEFLRQAFRKTQRKYGVDHPKTLAALLDFASFTSPEEAEQLYTDALNRFQTQLGDKHPDTMHCKMLLAETKLSLGNRTEAKEEFEDLFETIKKQLGASHPKTLQAHRGLLLALSEDGHICAAMKRFGAEGAGRGPGAGTYILLEILFHFSLRCGVLGVSLLLFLGLYLYSPFFLASWLWDQEISSAVWLLLVGSQLWLLQLVLLLCQLISPNRRELQTFHGLQINLALLLASVLLAFRLWLFHFSWFLVTAPLHSLELLWLITWLRRRNRHVTESSREQFTAVLASLERTVFITSCAARAEFAYLPEIRKIPVFAICILLLSARLLRSLIECCFRGCRPGLGCTCSQVFKSSVFSCVVSISRRDILRSRLVEGFTSMVGFCILLGGTYKAYRPTHLSAVWISLPFLVIALCPALSLCIIRVLKSCAGPSGLRQRHKLSTFTHLAD